ncbi:hypothetical protein FACS1894182_12690 [Bacteroidia bacterium]|nr:hypothetical protein FACS1894182_12690 [Bacteroidia bacterium]
MSAQENVYCIRWNVTKNSISTSGILCKSSYSTLQMSVNSNSIFTGNNVFFGQPNQIKFYGYMIVNDKDRRDYTPKTVTYTKGMSPVTMDISDTFKDGCKRTITASCTVTVDDPAVIEAVYFENTDNYYTCGTPGIVVKISRYYNNGLGAANLQILGDNGVWQTLQTVSSSSVNTIPYTAITQYVSPGKRIQLRTQKTLLNYSDSYSTSSKFLYYLPQFRFPAGKGVIVEPPSCMESNTTIKIPYEGNANYTLTVKGPNPESHGINVETNNPSVVKEDGYYVFKGDFDDGTQVLMVEYKFEDCSNCCSFSHTFTIIKPPSFTIGNIRHAYNLPDNTGNTVQIAKRGDKGRVYLQVSGSKERNIIIVAGSYTNSINLSDSYPGSDGTYYRGEAWIDLQAGTYTLQATNSSCISNIIENITLAESAAIYFTLTATSPSCSETNLISGDCRDGQIRIYNFSGGNGNYTYRVDGGSAVNVQNIEVSVTGLPADTYTITVSDSHENSSTQSVPVTAPAPIQVNVMSATPPTMACSADGTVTLSASGGTAPYTYGKTSLDLMGTATLTGFSNGSHTVYVKDAKGCLAEAVVTVPGSAAALRVISRTPSAPTCDGDEDGQCILVIGNVQGVLSVSADVPNSNVTIQDSTVTITGLRGGSHKCTVYDTKSESVCSMEYSYSIPAGGKVNIAVSAIPVSEEGGSDGQIEVNLSGSNGAPFRVVLYDTESGTQWEADTSTGSHTFSGLTGGSALGGKLYRITASDSKGCSSTEEVRLREPAPLALRATLIRPVSCHGSSDAIVSLSGEGGWGDYQYSRDAVTWDINNYYPGLPAGDYTFYVKDQYNAVRSANMSITDPVALTIERSGISHVLCNGSATGWIRFRISGGTYPYVLSPARGVIVESIQNGDTLLTVSGLPAGLHTFTVKDSRNCTAVADPELITEPERLSVSISNSIQPTCGWDNGSFTAKASGGTAPYRYVITEAGSDFTQTKTSADTVAFTDIPGGSYRITVTDDAGCTAQSPVVTFNLYVSPSIETCEVSGSSCIGGIGGRIEAIPLTGSKPIDYFYLYADSGYEQTSRDGVFDGLPAGEYWVVVYDISGCRSKLPYPVTVYSPESLSVLVEAVLPSTSKGAQEGKIFFRTHGGNPGRREVVLLDEQGNPVDEMWVVNDVPLSFSVYAGNYYLEMNDELGCSSTSDLIQVTEPDDSLHLIIKEVKDALCKSQTGRIVVEGAGGWGGYRYKRAVEDQFSPLNRFENLYPGSYVITVIDRLGATYSETIAIHEPQDSLRAEIINRQLPACGNNGEFSIRISGGTPPYRLFEMSDTVFCTGPQVVEWTGKGSGSFLLHLMDGNDCRFDLEAVLPETNLLSIRGFELTYPRIPGSFDGAIYALVEGGVEPYTFRWTSLYGELNGRDENHEDLHDISAGYYRFEVSDAAGCSAQAPVYLCDPGSLALTLLEKGDETLLNASNGYAILEAPADIYMYQIAGPSQSFSFYASDNNAYFHTEDRNVYLQNLESGKWFIAGTAYDGVQVFAEFEIRPFLNFGFGRIAVTNVSGPGVADGEIRVEIYGGGGGNTFVWTDSSGRTYSPVDDEYGSSILTGISAGIYTVTVTDRYGNRIVQSIEVQEPSKALLLSLVEQRNQSCKDYHDAYVVLEASGGWGDYQFRHEPEPYFNNGSSFPGLYTGKNIFYVIDKRGAMANLPVSITEPEYVRATAVSVDSVKCKDGADGRVIFDITGGTAPYSFKESGIDLWRSGNEATGLKSGYHTFMFTDNNGCEGKDTIKVYVPEPDSLLFRSVTVIHTTCAEDNGQIAVSMQGGTLPYSYRWLDFNRQVIGTDSVITGLQGGGLYRVEVTDANGCFNSMEQLIRSSALPRIVGVETTDVLCYGDSSGTARVTGVVAGEPYAPYTFSWSNGAEGESAGHFAKGQHWVKITDENGCSTTYSFEIGEPDLLEIRFTDVLEPHCYGESNGHIYVEAVGGSGGYSYLWSTGATTPDIDHLPKGDYWVRVTDSNGCTTVREQTLEEPPYLEVDLGEDVLMCPGNTHEIDGGEYVAYRWYTEAGNLPATGRYLRVKEEGHYFLEATTPDGCPAWGNMRVSIGNDALIADLLVSSEAAVGDTLILFELSNLPLDSLRWIYDSSAFARLTPQDEYAGLPYVLELLCLQTGVYDIGLYGYSGGCYSPVKKQVEVVPAGERKPDEWMVLDPLIASLKQYPNPSRGRFTVDLELREKADARFLIYELSSGVCVDQRTKSDSDNYRLDYNVQHLPAGVYILMVTAGNERKQLKLIIE